MRFIDRFLSPLDANSPPRGRQSLGQRVFPALYFPAGLPYVVELRRLLLMSANVSLLAAWASYVLNAQADQLNLYFAAAGIILLTTATLPWQRLRIDLYALFSLAAVAWVYKFLDATGEPALLQWFAYWVVILISAPLISPRAASLVGLVAAVAYSLPALARLISPVPALAAKAFPAAADWFIVAPLLVLMSVGLSYYSRLTAQRRAIVTASSPPRVADEQAAREEHMSMLSHELRNPLVNISAAAQVLSRELPESSKESDRAASIAAEAQYMLSLLEELMDVTQIELGKLRSVLAPIDLAATVRKAVANLHVSSHKVVLRGGDGELRVLADERRVHQVVANLIDNAIAYSTPGSEIEVAVGKATDGRSAFVSVRDHGPGIAMYERDRLFQKFTRLSTAGGTRGSGLGLYICRGIVADHAGKLWAEWPPDGGSSFHFTLPLAGAAVAAREARQATS